MASKQYPFVENGPERLKVSWGRGFGNLVVEMDGRQVNPEPFDSRTIKEGTWVALPDGSRLWVSRNRNGLELNRDGRPLPGTATHPRTVVKGASNVLWLITGLTLAATFVFYLGLDVVFWISLGSAMVFGLLALLVRRANLVALWTAVALYSLDTLLTLLNSLSSGEFPLFVVVVKVALIVTMARAIPVLRDLRRQTAGSFAS